jgi:hypothetical protein
MPLTFDESAPRAGLGIKFVDVGSITRDSKRMVIAWQPFRLEAYDQSGKLLFFAGVSHDESLPLQLRDLNRSHGAMVRRL